MMPEIPWNLQGIDPDARARAEASAQQAGMNVSQWLNSIIHQSATGHTQPQFGQPTNPLNPANSQGYSHPYMAPPQYDHGINPANAQTEWNPRQPFQNYQPQNDLSLVNSQISDLAARLDSLTRTSADTAIFAPSGQSGSAHPAQALHSAPAPNTAPQGRGNIEPNNEIRDIEKTLNNIVDLIRAADSRTNISLGEMQSRIDSLKSNKTTPDQQQQSANTAESPNPDTGSGQNHNARTRFEARRDRRLKRHVSDTAPISEPGAQGRGNRSAQPPSRPAVDAVNLAADQADFVALARSLEIALDKNNSTPPAVTTSDIDNLKAEIRALAGQVARASTDRADEEPNYRALYGQLEQISSQLHGNSGVSGALSEIEHKISQLFEQIQGTQHTHAESDGHDFNGAAQLAEIEHKLNLLFEQVQQTQTHGGSGDYHEPDETAHLQDIERKVSLLFEQFQQSQKDMLEASRQIAGEAAQSVVQNATEKAARMAVENIAQYLPERISGNEVEIVRNLEAGLNDVRTITAEADMQTQRTLNAVQDSLHAILDRLTYVEAASPQANQSSPENRSYQTPGPMFETPEPGNSDASPVPSVELPDSHTSPRENNQSFNRAHSNSAEAARRPTDNKRSAEPQTRALKDEKALEEDAGQSPESARPLEPGSGRPAPVLGTNMTEQDKTTDQPKSKQRPPAPASNRTEPELGIETAASLRNASTNEELLAAARRAARNAASTTASGKSEKKSLRERLRRPRKEPKPPTVNAAPTSTTETEGGARVFGMPKKPVLLTAAAILLFVGSMQIYGLMDGNNIAGTPNSPASVTPSSTSEFDGDSDPGTVEITPNAPDLEPIQIAPPSLSHSGFDQDQRQQSTEIDAVNGQTDLAEDVTGSIPPATVSASAIPNNHNSQTAAFSPATTDIAASPQNPARAHEMPPQEIGNLSLRQAAATGDPAAQFEVASRFAEGRGVPVNPSQAVQWYQRAAAQGLAPAQYRLGSMYEKGHGVTQDRSAARIWYQRAAELGNRKAMHNLAVMYADGVSGEPDMTNAARWFRKAADYGLNDSQFNLGILYARGLGTPRNLAEAYKWLSIAAANGDADASQRRDAIASELDQQTLAVTRLAIQTWQPEPLVVSANTVNVPEDGWGDVTSSLQQIDLPGREIILNTQKILTQLGFTPGPADGVWGPKTQTAISQFQSRQNLPQTGQLTPQIYRTLQQAAAQNAGV